MKLTNQAGYEGTLCSIRELEAAVAAMLDRERAWVARPLSGTAGPGESKDGADLELFTQRGIRSGVESELYSRYRDLAVYEEEHPEAVPAQRFDRSDAFGWDLIRARIVASLRQVDLAEHLGIDVDIIRGLELERYAHAELDLLQRIARAVGAEVCIVQHVA